MCLCAAARAPHVMIRSYTKAIFLSLILSAVPRIALSASGCDQGNFKALEPFEQELIKDFPNTSTWGHLCFDTTQGASDGHAQALFILGAKALSNFEYDFCRYAFGKLLSLRPDFVLGYWGRAMCNSQLLWNSEDVTASSAFLAQGRAVQAEHGIALSPREEGYYRASERLHNVSQLACKPCRVSAFLAASEALFAAQPDDANAAAYLLLANLVAASVLCSGGAAPCAPLAEARALAPRLSAQPAFNRNPAVLHYSLHAFDAPQPEVYAAGLPFARAYTSLVNGSVHALHMASHIFLRMGNFAAAAAADRSSVAASDQLNTGGALLYHGGPLGSATWLPGSPEPSGLGFAFDAGNTYHSLEYLGYESLQLCDPAQAYALARRMGVAAFQALEAGAAGPAAGPSAWFRSTTYHARLYRMQARNVQQAVVFAIMGSVGAAAEDASAGTSLPLPLDWTGSSNYSHSVTAPQGEAALWNALALESLLGGAAAEAVLRRALHSPAAAELPAPVGLPWAAPCGGTLPGALPCGVSVAAMAEQRVRAARDYYAALGLPYEGNLTEVLRLQVAAVAELAAGRLHAGLQLAQRASQLEAAAAALLLPSSTTIFFVPGSAFHGAVALRVASLALEGISWKRWTVPGLGTSVITLLRAANASFNSCLETRPGLAACLLGAARADKLLQGGSSRAMYSKLLGLWSADANQAARSSCNDAWAEAMEATKGRNAG